MKILVDFTVKGNSYLTLQSRGRLLGRKVEKGLKSVADHLMSRSFELVPKDTGYLSRTGRVKQIGSLLNSVFTVGYGGQDFPAEVLFSPKEGRMVIRKPMDYALDVHEIPATHTPPEQEDYLRKPAKDVASLRTVFFIGFKS